MWGDSDRPDFRRLYLTSDLEVYAEFRVEDVLATVEIPPEPDVAVVPDALERVTDREGS